MPVLTLVNMCMMIMSSAVQASLNGQFEQTSNYPTKQIMETLGNILADNDVYGSVLIQQGLLDFLRGVYCDRNNDDQLLRLEVIFCWDEPVRRQEQSVALRQRNLPRYGGECDCTLANCGFAVLRGGETLHGRDLQLHLRM